MSTTHRPVGRRSAAVYRRRRLMVLLVLLAIVAVVVLLIVHPGSGSADTGNGSADTGNGSAAGGTPTPHPTASQTPHTTMSQAPTATAKATPKSTPTATAKPVVAGQPCDPAHVDVEAITDASSYRSGARPLLSLSITNTGTVMCSIDAGTASMVFTVSSGHDRYWTSTDCQTNPVHTDIKLEPGKTLTSAPIAWDRTRSSKSTCGKARPAAPAGGASYHLSVSLAGIPSKTTKQFLLY